MKRLILSTIPDDFDPGRDIPLGPWCFLGKEDIYPGWEKLSFQEEPFPTPDSLAKASGLTCNYANELIPRFSSELNKSNKTRHSDKFWRLMIMPWLLTLIQALWDREIRLLQFIDKYKNIHLHVDLFSPGVEWKFRDSNDCMNRGILNPIYNGWLYSRILEKNMPCSWELEYNKNVLLEDRPIIFQRPKVLSFKEKLKRIIPYPTRHQGVHGIGFVESLFWSLFLSLKPIRPNQDLNCGFNKPNRESSLFKTNVDTILWASMPCCFKNLKLLETKNLGTKAGRIRLIGTEICHNELLKYYLGLAVDADEKLVCTQHGGFTGRSKIFPYDSEIGLKHYRFFSWGWG